MRIGRGVLPLAMITLVLVSACSSKGDQSEGERVKKDVRCANYQIDRQGNTVVNGLPVVNGITGTSKSEHCKLEITALADIDEAGNPNGGSTGPPLTDAPNEITDAMHVQWLRIEQEAETKHQFVAVPAYTFQCWIFLEYDPDFVCGGKVAATHKLSTYQDVAYELNGTVATELPEISLTFAGGQKDSYSREEVMGSTLRLMDKKRTSWTLLLILHTEWVRTGVAKVCLPPTSTVPCQVVRARAVHSEDYVLSRDTGGWNLVLGQFRQKIGNPAVENGTEPVVPPEALHRDYNGGPLTQTMGDVVTAITASWRDTDTTLQRQEIKGTIKLGVTAGSSFGTGTERGTESSAEISYSPDPDKVPPTGRCFELLSVGGKLYNKPVKGIVFKEGCPR